MVENKIHIVSLDVPFPPDYGGVIDIYYRAKALKEAGFFVVLHCFEYGRGTNHDFSEIANEIHYYRRKKSIFAVFSKFPFIVQSRISSELESRLTEDEAPILLEGHHCSGLLLSEKLKHRKKLVRIHNRESEYYAALMKREKWGVKKVFFCIESRKLKRFDRVLRKADALFCLNENEAHFYQTIHTHVAIIPPGFSIPKSFERVSEIHQQVLFHGNLSVSENEEAALEILKQWKKAALTIPLIIAGKNPSNRLKKVIHGVTTAHCIANPTEEKMNRLIASSAYNLLISNQETGVKLKLIQSLLLGNTCIVNQSMIAGTPFEPFCLVADSPEVWTEIIRTQMQHPISNLERKAAVLELINPKIGVDYVKRILESERKI